jgi:hypothetical protein
MKPSGLIAACLSVLAVLAGCDSGNPTIAQQAHTAAATGSVPGTQAYEDSVQRIYLAYFGRPADPAGLAYFEGLLQNAGAPVDLPSLSQAYMQPGGVHDIIEVFSSSRESQDLYAGDNDAFIQSVYLNLFNRTPDLAGKAYWIGLLNAGAVSRANAALAILSGAQGSDLDTIATKLAVTRQFTAAAADPAHNGSYDGLAANALVRGSMRTVQAATSTADGADLIVRLFAALDGLAKSQSDQLVLAPIVAPSMGDIVVLTPVIRSASGTVVTGQAVAVQSSDITLAKTTPNGALVALANGAVTLHASAGGLQADMAVTVRERHADPGEIAVGFGPEETVFDYAKDNCDGGGDVPDVPARAIRRSDGQILLVAPNDPRNYVSIGPDFSSLKHRCTPVLTSRDDPKPTSFHNREWLSGLYRIDKTIYGLVHNEYHDPVSTGCLVGNSGPGNPCWYNAITAVTSTDDGLSFQVQATPSELVAPPVIAWDPTNPAARTQPHGSFNPSNIIAGPDGYYYATYMSIPNPNNANDQGSCVIRTRTLADPTSWRAWGGNDFDVRLQNPYTGTPTAQCKPVTVSMNASLSFNTYFKQYLALGTLVWPTCGVYFMLSPDMVHWSTPRKIRDVNFPLFNGQGACPPPGGYGGAEPYAALIDHDSPSVNFDTSGQTAYLYLTRYVDASSPVPRNLVRMPIVFLKSATQGSDYSPPLMYLDQPVAQAKLSGTVHLYGWAIDDTGVAAVSLSVDGKSMGNITYGTPRPDVQKAYPWGVANGGYETMLDTTRLTNGPHVLTVRATDQTGNHDERTVTVTVAN